MGILFELAEAGFYDRDFVTTGRRMRLSKVWKHRIRVDGCNKEIYAAARFGSDSYIATRYSGVPLLRPPRDKPL